MLTPMYVRRCDTGAYGGLTMTFHVYDDDVYRRAMERVDIEGYDGNQDRLTEDAIIRDADGYDRWRDRMIETEHLEQIAKEMEGGL